MKISILIILLFFSLNLFAQNGKYVPLKDVQSFKNKMMEVSAKTNTIESNFIQEKKISLLSEKIVSTGSFCYKKADKLRWEYQTPYFYAIIINGNKIWMKDNKKVNEFDTKSNKVFKEINEIMIGGINGTLLNDNTKFTATFEENDSFVLIHLIPKSKKIKEMIEKINLFIDKNDYSVSKLELLEASEDYTTITFSSKKFNQSIGDEKFIVN